MTKGRARAQAQAGAEQTGDESTAIDDSDAAHAARWMAETRQLLDSLSALRHVRGQQLRSAALDLVPGLANTLYIVEQAGPERNSAGFLAASAVHAASTELAAVVARGESAAPDDLAHAAWLLGRAHAIASMKAERYRSGHGRPEETDERVKAAKIRRVYQSMPAASTATVVEELDRQKIQVDARYVRRVRKRMPAP